MLRSPPLESPGLSHAYWLRIDPRSRRFPGKSKPNEAMPIKRAAPNELDFPAQNKSHSGFELRKTTTMTKIALALALALAAVTTTLPAAAQEAACSAGAYAAIC